jgi:adenylate cyclase class IV
MIEVELRTFLTNKQYHDLTSFFISLDYDIKETRQITYYFKGEKDFRLMITTDYLMLWVKTGHIHDEARNEMIVKIDPKYKDDLIKMLHFLGYEEEIKWYRIRRELSYNEISVTIDYTYGYGYIMEAEVLVKKEVEVKEAKQKLENLFKELNIEISPKEIFKNKYEDYKVNWQVLTKDVDESNFLTEKIEDLVTV